MGFRFKKSVAVSYNRQGYIYFASKVYGRKPGEEQKKILSLCLEAGGEHYKALFDFVTGELGARAVCAKHYISESTLERMVRRYYELFGEQLLP